jgi:hypothetical protein
MCGRSRKKTMNFMRTLTNSCVRICDWRDGASAIHPLSKEMDRRASRRLRRGPAMNALS